MSNVLLVSATHLADFHLWKRTMPFIPKLFISVDLDLIRERGFTTHTEMDMLDTMTLQDSRKDREHGLDTPAFKRLLTDFKTLHMDSLILH